MSIYSDMASKDTKKAAAKSTVKPDPKKIVAPKAKTYEEDVITIELQYILTPIAILISGLMISASIFLALKQYGGGVISGGDDLIVAAPDLPKPDPTPEEEFAPVTASIDDDAILGNKKTAKVAIIEFSDYECPYCQQHWQNTHSEIVEKYIDTGEVIFVYRDLPLSFHPSALPAARAANCAREQGGDDMYYAYHDEIFKVGLTSESQLSGFADNLGLNASKFSSCVDSDKYDDEINADANDAALAGIGGTPGFVVGVLDSDGNVDGVRIGGAYPFSSFEQIIIEQLDRA